MPVKVGIPRALLYYSFYPLWKTFFEEIGCEVISSGQTTKAELQEGVKLCVDEACLPVKVFFGHIVSLKNKVDYIFLPRLVSVSPKEYICPKFLGLPDMVSRCIKDLPKIIDTKIDLYHRENDLYKQFQEAARPICANSSKISSAFKKAMVEYKLFVKRVESGVLPEKAFKNTTENYFNPKEKNGVIALLGHPYCIYDKFINMNLISKLEKANYQVLTSDNVPSYLVDEYTNTLNKRLFWTIGRRMIGSAYYYLDNPAIDGIIHVSSFACGPDSMTGELIERRARQLGNKPFLNLVLDEHTGEAGIVTRIEAFLDMLGMKKAPAKLKITV